MYEYQSSPEDQAKVEAMTQPAEPVELPREMLEARIQELEAQLTSVRAERNKWQEWFQVAESKINKAENWVRDQIAGSMEPSETINELEGLIDILDVETTREVEIEIQVSWRGTVNLPYGVEVEDLDVDDFGIDEPDHREYDSNFWGINDYEITER